MVSGITTQNTCRPLNSVQYLQRVGRLYLMMRASLRGTNRLFIRDGIRYYHTRHYSIVGFALVLAKSEKPTLTAEGASPWCQSFIRRREEQVLPQKAFPTYRTRCTESESTTLAVEDLESVSPWCKLAVHRRWYQVLPYKELPSIERALQKERHQ
jgi:hypothetical protein